MSGRNGSECTSLNVHGNCYENSLFSGWIGSTVIKLGPVKAETVNGSKGCVYRPSTILSMMQSDAKSF